ncbi:MAG TPA: UDP-N-acetylmuramoyl-tripeptide--D-alanyl-D-alanine ligase [Terriglobia bacterium]|jgi:UDP-N-acetylmuramoyl-tripeptide--D-alanyl-D-alanine ligase|nr:UDP-N-acetylmuramoyl-tripeptide--D-alanyl-D-alanine ligase [Terriglobia bacterium]
MDLTLGEVAAVLGSACGAPGRIARSYSIDSRTIEPQALFFALRGPNFDGHSFVAQTLERGASGAVVESSWAPSAPAEIASFLIPVADTVAALQDLGRAVRRKWSRPVIAVTGSTGKTTTKELLAVVLGARYAVHKSAENLNNHLGVPLTLLGLTPAHEVAVLEFGMSHSGEIAQLARIAGPAIGVVTNVAPVHLEFFDSLAGIAAAKRELIENLASPSTAILNYDDEQVRGFREGFPGRVVTYGFEPGADYRATNFRLGAGPDGEVDSLFRVRGPECEAELRFALPGRHNVANALAAIVAGRLLGVAPGSIASALAGFRPLRQRAEVARIAPGITLINDSYNSNPWAMEQMLELVREWPGAVRRLVLAGEMLELGPSAPDWHRRVGRAAAGAGLDWLLAVQGEARFFLEGAVAAGFPPERCHFFSNASEAGLFCRSILETGDLLLVKGSRGVHLEKAVELFARA